MNVVWLLMVLDALDWGRQHGARVSESIAVGTTSYGGKGLFAVNDIPANEVLINVPSHLQLGVGQLADGDDEEMQEFTRCLPWRDVIKSDLTFLPCAISICAELRKSKSSASIFGEYLQSYIPADYTNAIAFWGESDEPASFLASSAPMTATKLAARRRMMRLVHERRAPSSLSLRDLCWASAVVTSRSFTRKDPREVNPERIGKIAAGDSTRILPVIDLCNHGGRAGANAKVRHVEDDDGADNDPHSTSLLSTRAIRAGEEVLLDYGGGQPLTNEHLMIEYGFVLPDNLDDTATLRLTEDFFPALQTLEAARAGMRDVSEEDLQGIRSLVQSITSSDLMLSQGAPVLFGPNGKPSLPTLVLALALTCRGPEDVARILAPVREQEMEQLDNKNDNNNGSLFDPNFLMKLVNGSTIEHKALAYIALRTAAGIALEKMELQSPSNEVADSSGDDAETFDSVARDFCKARRDVLQRATQLGTS